jgi:hypothetical protein
LAAALEVLAVEERVPKLRRVSREADQVQGLGRPTIESTIDGKRESGRNWHVYIVDTQLQKAQASLQELVPVRC